MLAAREFYEAFAILSFLQYLLNYLGSTYDEISEKIRKDAKPVKHGFPFCCLRQWKLGQEFLAKCKFGVLSYVICKIFTATVTILCDRHGTFLLPKQLIIVLRNNVQLTTLNLSYRHVW